MHLITQLQNTWVKICRPTREIEKPMIVAEDINIIFLIAYQGKRVENK